MHVTISAEITFIDVEAKKMFRFSTEKKADKVFFFNGTW